jgi:hypothetical protein
LRADYFAIISVSELGLVFIDIQRSESIMRAKLFGLCAHMLWGKFGSY